MKINIGDYIRTGDGHIDKITNIDSKLCDLTSYHLEKLNTCYPNDSIIKSSPNLIDLIEAGDYVNGYKILEIWKRNNKTLLVIEDNNLENAIELQDIEDIVIKEQFDSIKYVVKEN